MYRSFRLRTKFLLSLLAVTAGLTAATLYVVRYNVEKRIRESFHDELHNSVKTYETFTQERESSLVRSAQMLANLPNVRALMTTEDAATIQDESAGIWRISGGDLLVLANRTGGIVGLQTSASDFSRAQAQESLRASLKNGESRNWWFGGGHLYEVWLQPIYFGAAQRQNVMGVLAVGHEINENRARDFGRVVASEVIFRCGDSVVATTLPDLEGNRLTNHASIPEGIEGDLPGEFEYGKVRYLATSVNLSDAGQVPVTLTVLKSLDRERVFLNRLNQILLGLGLFSVLAGGLLVFLLSHTFTQPWILDLNTTINEMGKMIPRLIGENIEFNFMANSKSPTVLADPGQMEQVFLNLAVNARDAMPNGGKLTVETQDAVVGSTEASRRPPMAPGDYVLLSVTDTGQGMSPETKAHIFEPFFTTKEIGKGTGLGLATVYGIIKQSGGFIWVESAIGKGTTFEIYLPHSDKAASLPIESQKVRPIAGGKETILVVEDEPGVRKLASEFLKASGYTILEAAEGEEALNRVNAHRGTIDILLTDMVMPGMSGAELAETLKKIRPEIRIIFMSGYAEFSGKNGERAEEAMRVLQKPFSRSALLEKVREAMDTAPGDSRDASKVG